MADKDVLYDGVTREAWEKELAEHKLWLRRHLYSMMAVLGPPPTLFDVGCGMGEVVRQVRMLGLEAWGIDQLCDDTYEEGWFAHHDLREPFSLSQIKDAPSVVDWVLCLEVGEHIPEENISVFCDTLCNPLKRDGYLIFSAAHPGQGGTEHITNRPSTFWHDRFYERGLNYADRETMRLKIAWLNIESPMFWLPANIGVFKR